MATIPLPALAVRPPVEQESPIQSIGQILQLKNAMLQQTGLQQENQQRATAIAQTQALNKSYADAVKVGDDGIPQIDTSTLTKSLADSKAGAAIPGAIESVTKYNKTLVDLKTAQTDLQSKNSDLIGHAAAAVKAAGYDPKLAHTLLDTLPSTPQLQALRAKIDDPAQLKQLVDSAIANSPAQQKMQNEQEVARIRAAGRPPEGELPLPNVPQMNQALTSRFQVLNPGRPLPPQFTLPANATQKDYDRIDKALESTEKAFGTKAQQDTANALREQAATLAKQNQQDREEKEGLNPVTGTDPKTGRSVLVSEAQAKKMGLTDTMKADADIVNKATNARHWLPLAEKQVTPELSDPKNPNSPAKNADQMGILQLIDRLDKRGELGVIASRWNEFLAGKVGNGDPEYMALHTKMGLSNTKLMQVHVGNRGGSFMLEHFEDLANAKKMTADALRTGVKSELDYVRDVAMDPNSGQGTPQSGKRPPLSSFEH